MKKIFISLICVCLLLTACTTENITGISPDSLTLIAQAVQDEADVQTPTPTSPSPPEADTPTPSPAPTNTPTATAFPPPTETPIPPTATPSPTNTPVPPTATPTTTPSPEPEASPPLVSPNDGNVNLRRGPGTNYEIIGVLADGESLEIVGRNADSSWWEVSIPDGLAWVADSVTTATNVDGSIPTVQLTEQALAADSASSAAPNDATLAQFQQGLDYMDAENWAAAIAEFEAVIQADPNFAQPYKYLGLSYALSGNFAQGISNLEQYLQLNPDASDRADVEAGLQQIRELVNSGAPDLPAGKGGIVMQNCRGDDITVDIIPSDILLELKRRNEAGCTRSELIVLDPGDYATRASIPGVPSLGEGSFTIDAGLVTEWTWH